MMPNFRGSIRPAPLIRGESIPPFNEEGVHTMVREHLQDKGYRIVVSTLSKRFLLKNGAQLRRKLFSNNMLPPEAATGGVL